MGVEWESNYLWILLLLKVFFQENYPRNLPLSINFITIHILLVAEGLNGKPCDIWCAN